MRSKVKGQLRSSVHVKYQYICVKHTANQMTIFSPMAVGRRTALVIDATELVAIIYGPKCKLNHDLWVPITSSRSSSSLSSSFNSIQFNSNFIVQVGNSYCSHVTYETQVRVHENTIHERNNIEHFETDINTSYSMVRII